MTSASETKTVAVLRPAELDKKDSEIVLAVAMLWADGHCATLHEVMRCAMVSSGGLRYRLYGEHSNQVNVRKGGSLVGNGWLAIDRAHARTLRPGPKFGGMQRNKGVIYERVELGPEQQARIRARIMAEIKETA